MVTVNREASVLIFQMKPKFAMYVVQILQVQPPGFQLLIRCLNSAKVIDCFIFAGTRTQILDPIYDMVYVP